MQHLAYESIYPMCMQDHNTIMNDIYKFNVIIVCCKASVISDTISVCKAPKYNLLFTLLMNLVVEWEAGIEKLLYFKQELMRMTSE